MSICFAVKGIQLHLVHRGRLLLDHHVGVHSATTTDDEVHQIFCTDNSSLIATQLGTERVIIASAGYTAVSMVNTKQR